MPKSAPVLNALGKILDKYLPDWVASKTYVDESVSGGLGATEQQAGVVELATMAEALTGAAGRVVTPAALIAASGRQPAMVHFDAAVAARLESPCRIVVLGSSTPAGSGATTPDQRCVNVWGKGLQKRWPSGLGVEQPVLASPSAEFPLPLSQAPGIHVYNAAEGNTTSATFVTAAERKLLATTVMPHGYLITVLSNDFRDGVPPATAKANLATVIDDLVAQTPAAAPTPGFIFVHAQERFDSRTHAYPWSAYLQILVELRAERPNQVAVFDMARMFAARVGTTDASLTKSKLYVADKIHLSDWGHALMAEEWLYAMTGTGALADAQVPGQVVAPPAQSVYAPVFDAFQGPSRQSMSSLTTADSRHTWNHTPGWAVVDEQAVLPTSAAGGGTAYVNAGFTDGTVRALVTRPASGTAAVYLRGNGLNNRLTVWMEGTLFRIGTVVNGLLTQRATGPIPSSVPVGSAGWLEISADGPDVTASLAGGPAVTYQLDDTTDAALSGTEVGMRASLPGNGAKFDFFQATRIGSAVVAADSMSRADAATLGNADTGQLWTYPSGQYAIVNGRAVMVSGSLGLALLDVGLRNGTIQFELIHPATGQHGLRARATGLSSGISCYIDHALGKLVISVLISGANTPLASTAIPASMPVGATVLGELTLNEKSITATFDGGNRLSATLTDPQDAAITGTAVGLRQSNAGAANGGISNVLVLGPGGASTKPRNALPVGDLPGWDQVVAEGFDIDVDSPYFLNAYGPRGFRTFDGIGDTAYNKTKIAANGGWYSNSALSVSNSRLIIKGGWIEALQKNIVANVLPYGWAGLQQFRTDTRFKVTKTSPQYKHIIQIAWSVRDVWADGEIDHGESGSIGGTFAINDHKVNVPGQENVNILHVDPVLDPATGVAYQGVDEHTLSTRWTEGRIDFYVDDVWVAGTDNVAGIPTHDMRVSLQVEVADLSGNTVINKANQFELQVDWMAIYRRNAATAV